MRLNWIVAAWGRAERFIPADHGRTLSSGATVVANGGKVAHASPIEIMHTQHRGSQVAHQWRRLALCKITSCLRLDTAAKRGSKRDHISRTHTHTHSETVVAAQIEEKNSTLTHKQGGD